jgi:ATPase subunit of ABC transporter with duplicated ATPase domains
MNATLTAKNLSAGYGDQQLFSGLDLVVAPGDVVGLVGANGAGKSTLLRILAGLEPPEHGVIQLHPPTATLGYLPQEPDRRHQETVRAFLARRTGVSAAQRELDRSTEQLAAGTPGADDRYAIALEHWLALGGADLDERAEHVAGDLGLALRLDQPMRELSGGQAARASMASLLLSRYDIFLLDEPTNNLDLSGLDRLEQFVGDLRVGTVLVSHDREFLTRSVNQVLEIDHAQRQVRHYGVGYAAYLEEREVIRRHAEADYEAYAEARATLEARARAQRQWAEKGVKNARRKATDNDKYIRTARTESSQKRAAKAKQTERMIERLKVVEEPRKEWDLRMQINNAPRAGTVVAELRGAVVRRGSFTLGPVDLEINWADRVAIIGANGAGKSTLLGALLGRLPLDAGSAWLGPRVVVSEIDQARGLFLGDEPLLEAFSVASGLLPVDARTLLAKFGLGANHVLRRAATLSPGERTRAALALLQAHGVNFLVLDEPTNHLDLPAIEELESALDTYPGTFILVTHDRRMLESVRTNRLIAIDQGHVINS